MRKSVKFDMQRLLDLKIQSKELEEEINELQGQIIGNNPPDSYVGEEGKLALQERRNYKIPSNTPLIKEIGQITFNERASMSVSKIKDAVGEAGLEKLLKKKIVVQEEPSKFYKLTVF